MAKEYIERKCGSCSHLDACAAWIRHCSTLYSDFAYSVSDCPYYLPTADVVEVVRRGECIHRRYIDMGDDIGAIGGCELFGQAMSCVDFCSYGERRDNNAAD